MKKKTLPQQAAPISITLSRYTDHPANSVRFPLHYAGYYIGGPDSPLHNPFKTQGLIGVIDDSGLDEYAAYLFEEMWKEGPVQDALLQLASHVKETGHVDLVCFCDIEGGDVCHGYVIQQAIEKFIQEGIV